jgi:hypothetical protein
VNARSHGSVSSLGGLGKGIELAQLRIIDFDTQPGSTFAAFVCPLARQPHSRFRHYLQDQ